MDKEEVLEGIGRITGRRPPVLARKADLFPDLIVIFNAWTELSRQRTRLVTPAGTFAMPITVQEAESWCRVHQCPWRAAALWDGVRELDATLADFLSRQAAAKNLGGPDAGS